VKVEKAVVIGAGIVGLCCALALQRAGMPTLLLDPGRPHPSASWGNAGHIAIEQVEPLASGKTLFSVPRRLTLAGGALALPLSQAPLWLAFALRMACAATPARFARGKAALASLLAEAMPAWQRLAASLPRPGLLIERGHVVLWHDARAAARGMAAWRRADTGTARQRAASPGECADLGRLMARPPAAALIFENTGQVAGPGAACNALEQAFRDAGGERRTDLVRRIAVAEGGVVLLTESGAALAPRRALLAAGVESGALLRPLGVRAPIIAERGYHIEASEHRWPDDVPPLVFEERSLIVTRTVSGLRAASFVEFSAVDAAPVPRRWQSLERDVAALGLPVQGPFARWHGARPTLPDYLPAIGRAAAVGNLFYAFGHQHLGLTLAPLTGELVAALMAERAPAIALQPFSLDRFRAAA
jgi:D-amino-acid dehydrogenase